MNQQVGKVSNKEYLDKCQVETPPELVNWVWEKVKDFRQGKLGDIIDLGAGDGRFGNQSFVENYTGVEIDPTRSFQKGSLAGGRKKLVNLCALSSEFAAFDICIGNPPFVRHHDLSKAWRYLISKSLSRDLNTSIDLRSNVYLYFLAKAVLSTKPDGLVAQIVPFEWVSRPSAKWLRDFIKSNNWEVHAFRLPNDTFSRRLTTSSLTIIEKRKPGNFFFYSVSKTFEVKQIKSPSGTAKGVIPYSCRESKLFAQRGLSPGHQKAFCVTESERIRFGLQKEKDVTPCITSFKHIDQNGFVLDSGFFRKYFILEGKRCWLVRSDKEKLSLELVNFLNSVDKEYRSTATCLKRAIWYKYSFPRVPEILIPLGFVKVRPKIVVNTIGAIAVGSVAGIYGDNMTNDLQKVAKFLRSYQFESRVVAHSKALKKVEINQINSILQSIL